MNQQSRVPRRTGQIVLVLVLLVGLVSVNGSPLAAAMGAPAVPPGVVGDGPIGLLSNGVPCLMVNSGPGAASGTVTLNWSGVAQGARVVLHVAGAAAAQPVWVNGQRVGDVPASAEDADDTPCGLGQAVYLDFAPQLLQQGQNQIEIGDSGLPGDAWTAANVRLEVLGPVQAAQVQTPSGLQAPTVVTQVVSFSNHLDGTSQQSTIQLPDGYNVAAGPVPLVIYAHSRYGDMTEGAGVLGAAANTRGWLLASPQLHGHWPTAPNPPGAFAYASLESQTDIVGTIQYMLSHPGTYNIDQSRIYLAGYSMGGQIVAVTGAKYPDIFAAVFDNKGPSDFENWYNEQSALHGPSSQQVVAMKDECYLGTAQNPTPETPTGNSFCYHRRSGAYFASNYLHEPISITHSFDDLEVPITHSTSLRDDINSFGPDRTASLFVDTTQGPSCPPYHHCYLPDASAVLGFFQTFTLSGAPSHLNLTSDESKSYYWLNIDQNGGDHWSYVEATANLLAHSVTLVVTDKNSLSLGINLGASPIQDWAGLSHPGLGLPAGTYHVQGAGLNTNMSYSSGYLSLALPVTNQAVITITSTTFTIHNLFLPAFLK